MILRSDTVSYTESGESYQKFRCTRCGWTAEAERGDWGAAECHIVLHSADEKPV